MRAAELIASCLIATQPAAASSSETTEHRLSDSGLTLIETRSGPDASDAIHLSFEIRNSGGKVIGESPTLVGELLISHPNREILSCERNGILTTKAALLFDWSAVRIASFTHPGFLRSCQLSSDEHLYLLQYNVEESGRPITIVVLLGPKGDVLLRRRMDAAGEVTWKDGRHIYKFAIDAPDLPG